MTTFKTRIRKISKENGCIILANDYASNTPKLHDKTIQNIKKLNKYLCGIKFNFHLLLPLGKKEIIHINKIAHSFGIQTIADIKLNDIGNTNKVTTDILWELGFDAVIANPIMGPNSLKNLVSSSHKQRRGVITLCHMSAPEAELSYNLEIRKQKQTQLYKLFLKWAMQNKVDGIVAGATFPSIIKYCRQRTKDLDIYSPGVGTQGGNIKDVLSSGTNFVIVGRSIINSKNPLDTIKKLYSDSI